MSQIALHNEFFSVRDLVQARYEMVRRVKQEEVSVTESLRIAGFKSRSSYYQFLSVIEEQGFAGLLDLRPLSCRQSRGTSEVFEHPRVFQQRDETEEQLSVRPEASIWKPLAGPWRNALHGLQRGRKRTFLQVVRALVEGNGVRGTSRIFEIDKNTALNYMQRAAVQCRRVSQFFLRDLSVAELQLDEMWSFVYKKEKHLSEKEYVSQSMGDQWCWVAIDARTKLIVQYEIGKRTYTLAHDLIKHFRERTSNAIPLLVTSDNYKGYAVALLEVYGKAEDGKRKVPPPEMNYAVVSKIRSKGRVVEIQVAVVFGDEEGVRRVLEESPVSKRVNVSFVERSHLSRRQFNRRLTRRTLGFSKKLRNHVQHYELETAVHNFVRPQNSLGGKTPIMAAGKTTHPWSIEELMSFDGQ